MQFDKIEFKNVFGYGNKLNTIEYTKSGKLILLKGKSGTGKSSILSLPLLVLFGKTDKIPKFSVANRINKNGLIRAFITNNGHNYIIERGFNPSSLTVFKDGSPFDTYGINDAQAFINEEIADISQPVFSNILTISMKRFKSFLVMNPYDKKQIIDSIFSLDDINKIYEKIKEDSRIIGNAINADNATLFSLSNSLTSANNELMKLQEKLATEENKKEIEENNKKIEELQNNQNEYLAEYKKYSDVYNQVIAKSSETNQNLHDIEIMIAQINQKIDLFNLDKCPTCGMTFSKESHGAIREQLLALKEEKNSVKASAEETLRKINEAAVNIKNHLNQITNNNSIIVAQINELQAKNRLIEEIGKQSTEFESLNNIISNLQRQIEATKNNIEENTVKMDDIQKLLSIFSVDGVKHKIIANYLPMLNGEIKKHLETLNFPYTLTFDSKFDPTVCDFGSQISIETLSDGEMTRVDLVVLCALLKILKFKYPSINLFNLDETISTLDSETGNIVLGFLRNFAKEEKLNITVVSHVELEETMFDEIIEATKNTCFSEITTKTL